MPVSSFNSANGRPASAATRLGALALLVSTASACSPQYEIARPGTWQPTGVNDANERAMVVDPRDLYAGTGDPTGRGDMSSRAVTRLLTDHRRPLLDVATQQVAAPSSGDTGGSGGGGAPGQ